MDLEATLTYEAQRRIAVVLGQAMIDKIVAETRADLVTNQVAGLKAQLDQVLANVPAAAEAREAETADAGAAG